MSKGTSSSNCNTISRRGLISGSAAVVSLAALAACSRSGNSAEPVSAITPAVTGQGHVPGIQLYTVRNSMQQSVPATLKAIAAIGYQEVEFAGYFDHSPSEIRGMLTELGISAPSSHLDSREMRDNPMPFIESASVVGHKNLLIAWLHPDDRSTIDDYKSWAEAFNHIGELCKDHGMRFAYHNHDFEFISIDGTEPYSVLMEETDPSLVDLELDFYWARKAGLSVTSVLERAPERFTMAHIKDMDSAGNMVDVGSGQIDFAAILANPAAAGLKHLFVEHDEPEDPFRSAIICHEGLMSIIG